MALTNAERQKRHRARRKASAVTPLLALYAEERAEWIKGYLDGAPDDPEARDVAEAMRSAALDAERVETTVRYALQNAINRELTEAIKTYRRAHKRPLRAST